MWAVRKLALDDTLRFVIFLGTSLAVATISFRLFERPIARAIRQRAMPQA